MKEIKVLHIGHSAKWRGGENQVRLLIERMNELDLSISHYLAFPKNAIIFDRLKGQVKKTLALPSNKPIDPRSIWSIVRFCKENKIDVLHTHSGNAHTLGFYAKKMLPDIKLVVHRRVDNKIKNKRATKRKFFTNDVDHFISISTAILNILKNYGVDENKISLIPSSVNDKPYYNLNKKESKKILIDKIGWAENLPLIGFISALENQKNPQAFIEIVNQLKKLNVKFNAIVAGNGKLETEIKELITKYNLDENVKMLGFVEDVSEIFKAIDLFILPSRNEGLGTVLLEAALAKTALIASDVGGISEIVIDQKTGSLIQSGDINAFIKSIQAIIENEEHRNKLIENATKHVNSTFSLTKMAEDTANVYKNVC